MPVTKSPPFGRTHRAPEEVRADARAAEAYWARLGQLDEAGRTVIIREGTPPGLPLPVEASVADPSLPASLQRATGHLLFPRVWDRELGEGSELERRERQLWIERIEHPTHNLMRRLRAEGAGLAEELAQERGHGGVASPEKSTRSG